jgi:hypothetical protein
MASTYVNDLRLNELATGDASGTWGTITNTNLELVAEAFSFGTEGITTNADTHTSTIADGATDPVRSMYVKYTGTLDSACTITIAPNTVSKLWFIENGTSGSQNIIISQGTGANVTIPAGDTKVLYSDGAGSGAAVVDAFASLSTVDLKVQDDLTVTDDATIGGTLGVTGVLTANAGVVVDNITIDGTEIDLSSGDLTIDAAGRIDLSADDNGEVRLFDGSSMYAQFKDDSDRFTIQGLISDADMLFVVNDGGSVTTALTLDASDAGTAIFNNKVGIGQSSPTGKLEITATGTNAAPHIKLTESGDAREFNIFNDGSGNGRLVLADSTDDTPDTEIVLADNGFIQFKTANSERMQVNDAGALLIGTTQEFDSLSGRGNLVVGSGSGNEGITIYTGNDSQGGIVFADGTSGAAAYAGQIQYTHSDNSMRFAVTDGSETMRIDSSGNLCLGTTSAFSGSILSVKSRFNSSSGFTTQIFSSDDAEQFSIRGDGAFYTGLDGLSPYNLTTGDNANAVITSDGVLRRSTSSLRYKKDIADATWGLSEVKQLRPVTFKSNRTGEFASDKTHGGLIAEEVHALGLTEFVDYNDSNEPDALHYGNMVALLTKAIQEQQTQIEALQSEINTLKGG